MSSASSFSGAGNEPGLQIWRVENLSPVAQPAEQAGTFFSGDSYVLLSTKDASDGSKSYEVHFWLGSETSVDESGAAAIFATELDDALGGNAKQYRQVQKAESPEFLELFKDGLFYKNGGVKSGFHHVESEAAPEPTLLQIRGKQHARVNEVPRSVDSLNSGDIFVLDLNSELYLWAGKDANVQEKAKAREVILALKEARKGLPKVISVEETETGDDIAAFYAALGVQKNASVSIKPAVADADLDDGKAFSSPRLYKVEDGSSKEAAITEITETPLQKSSLKSESAFILAADGWVFIWQGNKASSVERRASLATAHQLLEKINLPHSTPVQLVKEGFEEPTFRQHFAGWSDSTPSTPSKKTGKKSKKPSPSSESPSSSLKPTKATASTKSPVASKTPKAASSPAKSAASPAKSISPAQATKAPSPEGASPAKATTPSEEAADAEVAKEDARDETAISAGAATPRKQAADAKVAEGNSTLDEEVAAKAEAPAKAEALASSDTPSLGAAGAAPVRANGNGTDTQKSPSGKLPQRSLPKDSGFVPLPAATPAVVVPVKPPADLKYTAGKDTMPYEQLKGMRPESGIDMTRKEDYLSSDEFQKVFGKSQSEFKALPKWRQIQAKKDKGLF